MQKSARVREGGKLCALHFAVCRANAVLCECALEQVLLDVPNWGSPVPLVLGSARLVVR